MIKNIKRMETLARLYNAQHRKLKTDPHKLHQNTVVISGDSES